MESLMVYILVFKCSENFISRILAQIINLLFRKAHSSRHAVLDIVNTIQTDMDKRLFSCGVFIDLKKAFDTVDHKILLCKLYHYGFRSVINKWSSSYNTDNSNIASFISEEKNSMFSVPQGSSCLGPIAFSVLC